MDREIIEEIRVAIFGKNSQLLCGYTKPKSCDVILRAVVKFCIDRHFISIEAGTNTLNALEKIKKEESIAVQLTSCKFIEYLRELITSSSIPYRAYKDDKPISDAMYIRGGYPVIDVTYNNGRRYILIVSIKKVIKEMNNTFIKDKGMHFTEKDILLELKESGYFSREMMPKPNKSGYVKRNPSKEDLCYAIPYEKLFSNNS